ncbi:MAG: hypothetical protein RLZZ65_1357 [Bacteroidota bacterium]|jgi:hypothetical protein
MKRKILLLTFLSALFFFKSQAQTWSGEVAQIFYNKCTACHHPGGAAPTSFITHAEVSPLAAAIYQCVNTGEMPPWPPDNNYQQYQHNRALSSAEKTTVLSWLNNGAPEGNANQTPPPPVYSSTTFLGNGDLQVQIPTYMSKATTHDDYVCFSIPTNLTQNRVIKAVEVVPGNREIVHHCLIYLDPNSAEATDTIGGNCASPNNGTTKLVMGYTPGATPMILPSQDPLKLGIDIGPGSSIYFAMHYPMGSFGQFDSTKVILHFYPVGTTNVRQISAAPLLADYNFSLPANQVTQLNAFFPGAGGATLPSAYSVLSVFPHMHLLGTNIKAYAYKAGQDTVKFVNVPKWNFMWQDFYFFKHLQKVPAGYKLKSEGTYDNTVNNPNNPNNPPQTVYSGFNTTDEMFLTYFHYLPYLPGDETYDLEVLSSASVQELLAPDQSTILAYPNPFSDQITLEFPASLSNHDLIYLYDAYGVLVDKIAFDTGAAQIHLDAQNPIWNNLSKGVYYVSARLNGKFLAKKIIKM